MRLFTSENNILLKNIQQAVSQQALDDKLIRSLDPLKGDQLLQQLPALNKSADLAGLEALCRELLPSASTALAMDYHQSIAAMRDLGFILGSIKRHGQEPLTLIPELKEPLVILGQKTSLPPRDTLLHYTSWNPNGKRRRSYTGTEDESHLIESVKIAMLPLMQAIHQLRQLLKLSPESTEFINMCELIGEELQAMVNGIVYARKNVSTEYFANELRLYFDAIVLDGTTYLGPGAVEMPMFVFDHLFWSSQVQDEEYVEFKETYLPYILPGLREIYKEQENKAPFVDHIRRWAEGLEKRTENSELAFKALRKLCFLLKGFRMPHKKVADEAYEKDKQKRAHGSGGYTTNILVRIIDLMLEAFAPVEKAYEKYQELPQEVEK